MATIIIDTKTEGNARFILEFIKKIGEKGKILTKTESEDLMLGQILKEQKTGKKVSRATVMKNLTK